MADLLDSRIRMKVQPQPEYGTINKINGPLVVLENVSRCAVDILKRDVC
jgi:hypothetical protein